ncbi:MAG: hypothetical protein K2Y31_06975 [Burkholderiales bacterium]|jgi:Tfp pilus assembly protein PilN|nr:hypothetical protein [Burkholderiales bacterium]
MKRALLELDYVAPPRRSVWVGLFLLAMALGTSADLALRYIDARSELSRTETAQGLLNTARKTAKPVSTTRLNEQIKAAETIVRQLTLPWAPLIETLESTSATDVAVLQIQPETQQGLVRISAEARNSDAMWKYLMSLSATSTLNNVHLLNHQVQLDDPAKPLQFSVQAAFRIPR